MRIKTDSAKWLLLLILSFSHAPIAVSSDSVAIEKKTCNLLLGLHKDSDRNLHLISQYTIFEEDNPLFIKQWIQSSSKKTVWEITNSINETVSYPFEVQMAGNYQLKITYEDKSTETVYIHGYSNFLYDYSHNVILIKDE